MPSSLDRVLGFARGAPGGPSDAPSDTDLARAFDDYRASGHRRLSGVRIASAGVQYGSLYDAIRDGTIGLETAELELVDPPSAGPAWEFLRPFRRLELFPDGSAELAWGSGPPQRAIARVLLRSSDAHGGDRWSEGPGLAAFGSAVEYLRSGAVVPFDLVLCLYFADERVRFEFDLTDDALLKDPRAGRIPVARRARRSSRLAWSIDHFLATAAISASEGRLFDVLADLRSVSLDELVGLSGGDRAMVGRALSHLGRLGVVQVEATSRMYRIRLEPFRPHAPAPGATTAPRGAAAPEGGGEGLQSDLAGLVASAESRATCPLCGTELPAGYAGIVCAKCAAEVSDSPSGA